VAQQLDRLAEDPALQRFRPFHVARGVTLEELGDHPGAILAYRRALALPGNEAEDEYLSTALAGLSG
jgi:RNA polymerase sigma-70 factor (ECF subfamily)